MPELVITTKARVIEIGEAGDGEPSVTLDLDGAEVLFKLKSIAECRRLAPVLMRDVPVTLKLEVSK
jgi:hypothetical protein